MEPNQAPSLATVMDMLLDAVCVVDVEGRYLFVSAAYERIFGYRPGEVLGRKMIELVHPDDRERTRQAAREIMAGRPKTHFQNRYVRKDGRIVDIMWSARWSETDRVRIAVARDITDLKRAETVQAALLAISEAAHTAEDLLELFQRIHHVIGTLLPAANCFVALLDEARTALEFPYFVDEHDPVPGPITLDAPTLTGEVVRTGEALLLTPSTLADLPAHLQPMVGHEPLDWLGVPLRSPKGVVGALVVQSYDGAVRYSEQDKVLLQFVSAQIADAIERKRDQARLLHLANHDLLTDLPNRERFHQRLQAALGEALRENTRLAVLYLDLDGFKQINDRHGHDVGDLLLREAARRIRGCVRESDTVARVGGDEFVVLLHGMHRTDHATVVAGKLRGVLRRPFSIEGSQLSISASIGIALCPEHGAEERPLIRHADDAMYEAKKQGGDRYVLRDGYPAPTA